MPSLKPNGKRLNGKGSKWIQPWRRLAIYLRDGFRCQYCGRDLTDAPAREVTLDHVVPQCQGGDHHETNLITACLNCNSQRQHLPLHKFIAMKHHNQPVEYIRYIVKQLHRQRRLSIRRFSATAKSIIAGRGNPIESHTHCPKEI